MEFDHYISTFFRKRSRINHEIRAGVWISKVEKGRFSWSILYSKAFKPVPDVLFDNETLLNLAENTSQPTFFENEESVKGRSFWANLKILEIKNKKNLYIFNIF